MGGMNFFLIEHPCHSIFDISRSTIAPRDLFLSSEILQYADRYDPGNVNESRSGKSTASFEAVQ
jgi:hypothetical protein